MDKLFNEDGLIEQDGLLVEGVEAGIEMGIEAEAEAAASSDSAQNNTEGKEAKFNDQLSQLENIVAQLESGQLDLEDSLKRYGQGVELITSLQAKLADAEQKVQIMMGEIAQNED